jgi:hypothetical protein
MMALPDELQLAIAQLCCNFTKLNPFWEPASCSTTQECPNISWKQNFIMMPTRAFHWSVSGARLVQPITSHPISLKHILMLPSQLSVLLYSDLFLAFSQKPWTRSSALACKLYELYIPSFLLLLQFWTLFIVLLSKAWRFGDLFCLRLQVEPTQFHDGWCPQLWQSY